MGNAVTASSCCIQMCIPISPTELWTNWIPCVGRCFQIHCIQSSLIAKWFSLLVDHYGSPQNLKGHTFMSGRWFTGGCGSDLVSTPRNSLETRYIDLWVNGLRSKFLRWFFLLLQYLHPWSPSKGLLLHILHIKIFASLITREEVEIKQNKWITFVSQSQHTAFNTNLLNPFHQYTYMKHSARLKLNDFGICLVYWSCTSVTLFTVSSHSPEMWVRPSHDS